MARRGTKPTPTALKEVRGNPGRRPLNPREPKIPRAPSAPPAQLDQDGREEWTRVFSLLEAAHVVTAADIQVLAAYCAAYSRWVQAERALQQMAERDALMAGLMIRTANGNVIQNPLVGVANKAMEAMVRYAAELGMTPSSRSRVQAGAPPERGRFAGIGRR